MGCFFLFLVILWKILCMEIKEAFDVIKETKEDFKNVLLERLKLPIINYYIFFLIIYNWDIIVMLFFL